MNGGQELDLGAVRRRLGALHGRPYWEALDEVAGSEAVRDYVREHYPSQQHRWLDGVLRRDFLKLMGASLALGGLGTCTR
ncbi:MAG: TAT-variant-translocated molybdopterin oxidoreductase [Planctomycetota bacterium]